MSDKKYPVSEVFSSIQGEGMFCGTPMTFIRLAGCSVGKKYPKEQYQVDLKPISMGITTLLNSSLLPIYVEECTTYDGRKFPCDTDFRTKGLMDIQNIMALVPKDVRHICITGGEPCNHNLDAFYYHLPDEAMLHVETSGTVPLAQAFSVAVLKSGHIWITVSPKFGVLPEVIRQANEIKLLVDENFDIAKVPQEVRNHSLVYLQPINFEHEVNANNLRLCRQLVEEHKNWRLSGQFHKVLEHFLGERVR